MKKKIVKLFKILWKRITEHSEFMPMTTENPAIVRYYMNKLKEDRGNK